MGAARRGGPSPRVSAPTGRAPKQEKPGRAATIRSSARPTALCRKVVPSHLYLHVCAPEIMSTMERKPFGHFQSIERFESLRLTCCLMDDC